MEYKSKRIIGIILFVAVILLIPFIAMQFTNEVKWDLRDFLIMGGLLLSTGIMCEFVLRKVTNRRYRIALCAVLLVILFLIWAELAVGLFGSPFAGS